MPPDPARPASSSVNYPVNRLKTMAVGERPQERMERHGPDALSDTELLAMLLRSGTRGNDVLTLATRLLAEAGSLAGLIAWRPDNFRKLKGIGRVKALQLMTVMEVARRVLTQEQGAAPLMEKSEAVVTYLRPFVQGLDVEKVWVLSLNRKNRLLKCNEISSGISNAALAHPREVYRDAIREGASALIVAHNHPSGDPSPSSADVRMTRQLREAGHTVEIPLIDHLIVGTVASDPLGLGFYSFRAGGLL